MKTNELINIGSKYLKQKKIPSNRLDSEIILSHIMGVPRENLLINEKTVKKSNSKIKKL